MMVSRKQRNLLRGIFLPNLSGFGARALLETAPKVTLTKAKNTTVVFNIFINTYYFDSTLGVMVK